MKWTEARRGPSRRRQFILLHCIFCFSHFAFCFPWTYYSLQHIHISLCMNVTVNASSTASLLAYKAENQKIIKRKKPIVWFYCYSLVCLTFLLLFSPVFLLVVFIRENWSLLLKQMPQQIEPQWLLLANKANIAATATTITLSPPFGASLAAVLCIITRAHTHTYTRF